MTECENLEINKSYFIEFEFFGESHKFKVKHPKDGCLSIKKLRLFYFFSNGRNAFCHFLSKNSNISVKLITETGSVVGYTNLLLKDFESPYVIKKFYYQNMGGPMLKANIGMT